MASAAQRIEMVTGWLLEIGTARNQSSAQQLAAQLLAAEDWTGMVDVMRNIDMSPAVAEQTADLVGCRIYRKRILKAW